MIKSNHILYNADTKNCRFQEGLYIVRILVIDGPDIE